MIKWVHELLFRTKEKNIPFNPTGWHFATGPVRWEGVVKFRTHTDTSKVVVMLKGGELKQVRCRENRWFCINDDSRVWGYDDELLGIDPIE